MEDTIRSVERTVVGEVLPIFRSENQAKLLAAIFLAPESEVLSLERLAVLTEVPYPSVHREIARLQAAGLVVDTRIGNLRRIQPNPLSPFCGPLAALIDAVFGPVPLLRDALGTLAGVEAAALYGSWAARSLGEPGDAPGDVDVLVIGAPDPAAVYRACRQVEDRVRRPVNPTIARPDEWRTNPSGFFDQIARTPRVELFGDWAALLRDTP